MTTTQEPTIYHASVDDLRRDLMATHLSMMASSEKYLAVRMGQAPVPSPKTAVSDAWVNACAAWNATYVLAAVLGVAGKEFGDEVALRLANVADNLLANGDDDPGHNADVTPAGPESTAVTP